MVAICESFYLGKIFKAVFLLGFFGFLRLSNIVPHSKSTFDSTRHLTRGDVVFSKKFLKLTLKWTKTIQTRDRLHILTLPRLKHSPICPYKALKKALEIYNPGLHDPLFQHYADDTWSPMTDTRVRKCLARVNTKLGLGPHFYPFHAFRRSGATLAYQAHIPIQQIKYHGSWASDCVYRYIQQDEQMGEGVATALTKHLK